MRRVGLTGGIATGKSAVLRRFGHHGVPTIDADVLARAVVAPGTPGAARILERFGEAVRSPDGGLDRRALGAVVFGDESARRDLEAIVHPAVYEAIGAWYASLPRAVPFAVADIPLLYETGHAGDFDVVVVTVCDPAEQVRRLLVRDGLSVEEAVQRLAAQLPLAEKARRADHVIRTDGSHEATDAQVDALVRAWSV
jgi:dephospho-CoA kinase